MKRIILTIKILGTYMNLVHQFYFSEKLKNVVTWKKNKKREKKEIRREYEWASIFSNILSFLFSNWHPFHPWHPLASHIFPSHLLWMYWLTNESTVLNFFLTGTTAIPTLDVQGLSQSDLDIWHCLK